MKIEDKPWEKLVVANALAIEKHGTPSRDPALRRRISSRWQWAKVALIAGIGGFLLLMLGRFTDTAWWMTPLANGMSVMAVIIIIGIQASMFRDRRELRQMKHWHKEFQKQMKELS